MELPNGNECTTKPRRCCRKLANQSMVATKLFTDTPAARHILTCLHRSHSTDDRCARPKLVIHPRVMFHLAPHSTLNIGTSSLSPTSPELLSSSYPNPDLLSAHAIVHCEDPRRDGTSTEFHFSTVRRKVAIQLQGDPSCPSGVAMFNRAMYGTEDAAQCFDLCCERTMKKLDYNIGVFNPCLYKHPVKDISALRHTVTTLGRSQHGLRLLKANIYL